MRMVNLSPEYQLCLSTLGVLQTTLMWCLRSTHTIAFAAFLRLLC
jgi:hypothetical protein